MLLVADTHVHLYPCYDLNAALLYGFDNLQHLAHTVGWANSADVLKVLFLTERHDCEIFNGLAQGRCIHPGFSIEPSDEGGALWVNFRQRPGRLLIVAGRQIVTQEKLELLALAMPEKIQDGSPIFQAIEEVLARGGVPVLNWSPGKWFGKRGRKVKELIKLSSKDRFLVGDIGMRPKIWGEPILFALARRSGFRLAAGSDPLPFKGEERNIGSFGVVAEAEISNQVVVTDLRRFLWDAKWKIVGRRDSLGGMLRRQWLNRKVRKAQGMFSCLNKVIS